jgi:hypothetical protein
VTRRRLIACVSVAGLGLMLLVGAAAAGLIVMRRPSLASAGECVKAVEELPLAPLPEDGTLPPLEVIRADWPTAVSLGAWRHWRSGSLRVGSLALDVEGEALWMGAGVDLSRWDLNTLSGTRVDIWGFEDSWGDDIYQVGAIVPTGPGQLWVVDGRGPIIRYDGGSFEVLTGGGIGYGLTSKAGVDGSGVLWLTNISGDWERCVGYPSDWRCERGQQWREPPLTQAMGCTSFLASLDARSFWSCATAPGRMEVVPFDAPPCDSWQAVSGSMRCVTWDQDCAGQLVLLSLDPREVVRTVPWPNGVDLVDVRLVSHNEGQVWLFSDALWLFEAGRWQRFEWPYDAPSGLVADPAGDGAWVTVTSLGLLHVNAEAVRMVHPRDSLYALPVDRDWTPIWKERPGWQLATLSLAETAEGRIWAGTDGGGLWVYDEAEVLWQPTELTQAFVDALQGDGDGGLWVGTRYGGIAHYDGKEAWQWWRTYSGLPSDSITALAVDQRGWVWAGTADAGLIRFDGVAWEQLQIDGVEPDGRITALAADGQGSVFFVQDGCVGACDAERCSAFLCSAPLTSDPPLPIRTLALDQLGNLWVTTPYSVYGRTWTGQWKQHVEPGPAVGELLIDSREQIWAGTGCGASTYRAGHWQTPDPFGSCVDARHIYGLFEDRRGRIWVARTSGVSMYDPALDEIAE